jgi:hypothetical protein
MESRWDSRNAPPQVSPLLADNTCVKDPDVIQDGLGKGITRDWAIANTNKGRCTVVHSERGVSRLHTSACSKYAEEA